MKKGLFIVLEGIDGSGKTTQAKRLARKLKGVYTHEPTKGKIGKLSVTLFKQSRSSGLQAVFAADRAEHVKKVILPSLKKGRIVVCDRYILSSLAYAPQKDVKFVKVLNQGFPVPDKVFLLDLPERVAKKRKPSISEIAQVRKNFLKHKGRAIIIDAKKSIDEVAKIIEKKLR